jgi:hypothetical protein
VLPLLPFLCRPGNNCKTIKLVQAEIWPLRLEAQDWPAYGRQSPANKPQNQVQPATPPKSAKLHANTFITFNFKKWLVTASGEVRGERFYEYVQEIAIEVLSKKIKIFNNYHIIHAFWWRLRAFRGGES